MQRSIISATLLIVLTLGCDTDRILSGQWFSVEALPYEYIGGSEDMYVELNLGHYGREVFGVLRFYTTEVQTTDNRKVCSQESVCGCQAIQGTYNASRKRFVFSFKPCLPPPEATGASQIAIVTLSDTNELIWETKEKENDVAQIKKIVLERTKNESQLRSLDKMCDDKCGAR
jgi:hypothetical protein